MKKIFAIVLLSLLVAAPMAFATNVEVHNPPTGGEEGMITLKGDVELDNTFDSMTVKNTGGSDGTVTTLDMGGRVYFQVIGRWENKDTGFFVAGQGQPLFSVDGVYGMDDAWFQFGNKSYSLKLGRFEALEFLGTGGEDVFIAGSPTSLPRYQGNYARGRTNGGFALDFNASDAVMVEIGGVFGQHADFAGISQNKYGIRPGIQLKTGGITFKGGADVYFEKPQDKDVKGSTSKIGFGGEITATLSNVTVNVGAASGTVERKDYTLDANNSKQQTTSVIGWATMPMGDVSKVGAGAGYTKTDKPDINEIYVFGTYEYKMAETTWAKLCASYAKIKDGNSDLGLRLRFDYGF